MHNEECVMHNYMVIICCLFLGVPVSDVAGVECCRRGGEVSSGCGGLAVRKCSGLAGKEIDVANF